MTTLLRIVNLLIIGASVARAIGDANVRGAHSSAMSGACVALMLDARSVHTNPAALAALRQFNASALWVASPFGLPELATISMAAGVPCNGFVLGFNVDQFGYERYKEWWAGVTIAAPVSESFSVGIHAEVLYLSIARYGTAAAVTSDLAFTGQVMDGIRWGWTAENIAGTGIGATKERLPQVMNLGLAVAAADGLTITAGLELDPRFPLSIRAGLEQSWHGIAALRAGVGTEPDTFAAGIAFFVGGISIEYAGSSHPVLGWTHQFEVGYSVGEP